MISFDNLEIAYSDKTNKDLNRSYFLFKTISYPKIVKLLNNIVKLSINLKLPINPIIKATIYKHFCGGTSISDCKKTIEKLADSNIGTILDYAAEGKNNLSDFNRCVKEITASIKYAAKNKKIPFAVFKMTGISSKSTLEKMSVNKVSSEFDKNEITKVKKRIDTICREAYKNNIPVLIDAEESWLQNAIDDLALEMMKKYNKERVVIYNTVQLYLTDRISYIQKLISESKRKKFYIGLKLVRGAYHQQEINKSKELKELCPVHTDKESTDRDYNRALEICMENIENISICAGTHNEFSCRYLAKLMKKYKLANNHQHVHFSQLYGMSDHISYNLAYNDYNVSKYVPYGPVKDMMPYLIRRAEENTSITGQIGRELKSIILEKKRRKRS